MVQNATTFSGNKLTKDGVRQNERLSCGLTNHQFKFQFEIMGHQVLWAKKKRDCLVSYQHIV